jgi:hypothetical protein
MSNRPASKHASLAVLLSSKLIPERWCYTPLKSVGLEPTPEDQLNRQICTTLDWRINHFANSPSGFLAIFEIHKMRQAVEGACEVVLAFARIVGYRQQREAQKEYRTLQDSSRGPLAAGNLQNQNLVARLSLFSSHS